MTLPTMTKETVTIDFDYYLSLGRPTLTIGTTDRADITTGKVQSVTTDGAIFNFGISLSGNKTYAMGAENAFTLSKYTDQWVHFHVVINQSTQKVSYTVSNDTETIKTATDVAYVDSSIASGKLVGKIDFHDYISNGLSFIDNVKIQNTGAALSE